MVSFIRLLRLLLLAVIVLHYDSSFSSAYGYITPDCPDKWPSSETWSNDLGSKLSTGSALHGPFFNNDETSYYATNCETLGSDAYAISQGGSGICLHAHACQYEFCRSQYPANLPAYIVEAKIPADVQAALQFASQHEIAVTVKTTGHSYHGASTAKNSLLIWMQNFEKNGAIIDNYQTCNGTTVHAAITVNGGETWNDVIEAVGPDYHVVTGGGRTVSAAGGWLQGSGLSFSSREYGLGVDQALEFQVVLADGTLVVANDCQNADLFWALRGGGGGTFGVVTQVMYKLHPAINITETWWFVAGWENAQQDSIVATIDTWLEFWINVTSTGLDSRFGGYWSAGGVHLAFAGTREEANDAFLNQFEEWYFNTLLPKAGFIEGKYGALPPSLVTSTKSSWYEYKGGAAAYNNPKATDPTGDSYAGVEYVSARLMPLETVQTRPQELKELLIDLALRQELGGVNYILGGNINTISSSSTSVSPVLRNAAWNIFTTSPDAHAKIYNFVPNAGACFNHHSPVEPDWRKSLWGTTSQYDKLLELKEKYDPNKVFNCWHCVGYQGEENPKLDDNDYVPECIPQNDDKETSGSASRTLAGLLLWTTAAFLALFLV